MLLAEIANCGLVGRGGGGFPLVRKVEAVIAAASASARASIVVVNASESEPASRKDETLLGLRPHVVLDGAAIAARAVGADEVVIHLHRGSASALPALQVAFAERVRARVADPRWHISQGPRRYVAGESTAVVSHIEGGQAKPRFTTLPLAARGVHDRPTLLNNVETLGHLALIARYGAQEWRSFGASPWSGPTLVTLHGGVTERGLVVEITGHVTIGELLVEAGGLTMQPAAVLVGGYAGSWLPAERAWRLPVERAAMTAAGAPPGCGLIAVLPSGMCGIRETARVLAWLADEGAGQCGPCVFGLPAIAELFDHLAGGRRGRRVEGRFVRLADRIAGRGACRHPDGVVQLARTALAVFADDVQRHRKGQRCGGEQHASVLPLPSTERGWR